MFENCKSSKSTILARKAQKVQFQLGKLKILILLRETQKLQFQLAKLKNCNFSWESLKIKILAKKN